MDKDMWNTFRTPIIRSLGLLKIDLENNNLEPSLFATPAASIEDALRDDKYDVESSAACIAAVEAGMSAMQALDEYLAEKLPHVKRDNLQDLISNLNLFKTHLEGEQSPG